jgi:precorrin-2/cobalt-factor-2 C20-methyltransferase
VSGTLYGIGIGPGDPELITLKAKRRIEACPVIVAPVRAEGERSTALGIVRSEIDLEGKTVLELVFEMSGDAADYDRCGDAAAEIIIRELERGRDVAMISLGDVSVYSTYMYTEGCIRARGYRTVSVPGIPSFCGGAALAGIPLTLGDEGLAIVPAAKGNPLVEAALDGFENVVIMKAGRSLDAIAGMLEARGLPAECATVIHNVGMEGEYIGPIDVSRDHGYFTTVIVKRGGRAAGSDAGCRG